MNAAARAICIAVRILFPNLFQNFSACMPDSSMSFPAIEVSHLSKRVADATGELIILEDVNFTMQAGETQAGVGASSTGKSTLHNQQAGLDTPSEGTVMLN